VTSLSRNNDDVSFELEGSPAIESRAPAQRKLHEPPDVPVELELEPVGGELDPTGKVTAASKSSFLAWLALSFALICLPPSIAAAFLFLGGVWLWPIVMIPSMLAVCFGRYAKNQGGPSANLAGLAVQLGRGFFLIAGMGLLAIGISVLMFGLVTVQSFSKNWSESNALARWVTDKVDAVEAYFSGQGQKPPPALPSPSPNSSPAP
jgi:hypothetical protein